jgi:flavin prenyltransferase
MNERQSVIVGISGASGAAIGVRIIERLAEYSHCAVHLVVSPAAERTLYEEVGGDALARLRGIVFREHLHSDVGACIASGSFPTGGMIVAPCSIRTLSAIAWGQLDNLLVRAADVQLKERRRLVLLVRESPLHLGHLRSMAQATEMGAIIAPPLPAFYLKPQSLGDVVDHIACRAINLLGLPGLCVPMDAWFGGTQRE